MSRPASTGSLPGSARSVRRSATCRSPARPSCPSPARTTPSLPTPRPGPRRWPPEHPAYQQILTAFADLGRPLRARDLCVALDLPILPKNTESIRAKLKRLVSRGILIETEPGLFAQPRP
jgi:hypothetical protein